MKKILILSYYEDKNAERNRELIYCLRKNLEVGFDYVYIFSEVDKDVFLQILNSSGINSKNTQIIFRKISQRPTFNDFFEASTCELFKDLNEKIFFIFNSDIFITELQNVEKLYSEFPDKEKLTLCLSRWDVQKDNSLKFVDRCDSQDAWIFYNDINFRLKEDFSMGIAGCDNRLAYELYKKNYILINPSKTIKIHHYHLSNVRRYINDKEVNEAFVGGEKNRISGPYHLIYNFEKLTESRTSKKIISFCLYGNDPKYCLGAIKNCILAKYIYPDWMCRFYISKDVNINTINDLKGFDNTEIVIMNEQGNFNSMFWRFLPICDSTVEIMICRDCDSRLSMREKNAVDEWINSDKKFHIIRDHPLHHFKIMGGLFGVKKDCFNNFSDLYQNYCKPNAYNGDQFFLQDIIYPLIQNNSIIHDEFFENNKFPTERNHYEFIGEIIDQNENTIPEHRNLIKQHICKY